MRKIAALTLALLLLCGCSGGNGIKESVQMNTQENATIGIQSVPTETKTGENTPQDPASVSEGQEPGSGSNNSRSESTSTSSESNKSSGKQQGKINSAYQGYDTKALAVILNEPFSNPPKATVTWSEGRYDRAYIIPQYVGSVVNAFLVEDAMTSGDLRLTQKPVFSTTAKDGCVIYGALERPEGYPRYYIQVIAPDGTEASMYLSYNGESGSPAVEKLLPQ